MSQHFRGSRVSQQVRTLAGRLDTGAPQRMLDDTGNAVARGKWHDRSDAAKEYMIRMTNPRPAVKIGKQCISDILRQRQSHLVSAFARYQHGAIGPVDI